jgi:predicted nucleic acid-binding Zn ribbon protein
MYEQASPAHRKERKMYIGIGTVVLILIIVVVVLVLRRR